MMQRQRLAHLLEHLPVEMDDAVLAAEHDARTCQLAHHIVGVVLAEALEVRVAKGARVLQESPAPLGASAEARRRLRDAGRLALHTARLRMCRRVLNDQGCAIRRFASSMCSSR